MATTISSQVLVSPEDVFATYATNYSTLGAKATTGDGRAFRYCLAGGTTLVPGTLQQSSAEDTTNYQNLAAAATSIGATQVVISTSTTVAANVFAGGLMVVTTSTGAGYVYQVGGNTATTAATGLTITLNDPIMVATDTNSRFDLIPNPYSAVVINPTTATSAPAGVAVYPVTNGQYGWLQVQGVAPLLADGSVVVGTQVVASNGTAGAVEALTGVQAVVGTAMTGIATTQYGLVNLELA